MVKGIEHTAIASTDPQRLADWYEKVLGFRINYRSSNSRTVFVKAEDGTMIEIIEAARPAQGSFQFDDPGLRHLALVVADFPAACEELKRHGVKFLKEPATNNGNSLVFFADPDGNILHLLHREKPLP
jgi:glyoxylase I family protein